MPRAPHIRCQKSCKLEQQCNQWLTYPEESDSYEPGSRLIVASNTWSNWLLKPPAFDCFGRLTREVRTPREHSSVYNLLQPRKPFLLIRPSSTMTDTKRELKLSFFKNWNAWLSVVRAKVTEYSIWDLIDSFKEIRSIEDKVESSKSDLDQMRDANFVEKHARYKIASSRYKKKLQEFKTEKSKRNSWRK